MDGWTLLLELHCNLEGRLMVEWSRPWRFVTFHWWPEGCRRYVMHVIDERRWKANTMSEPHFAAVLADEMREKDRRMELPVPGGRPASDFLPRVSGPAYATPPRPDNAGE